MFPGGAGRLFFGQMSGYVTGSNELMVPGRVVSCANIPQGTMSAPFEASMLKGQPDVSQLAVEVTSKGILELHQQSKGIWSNKLHWIRAVRLSDDCHSYNLLLRLHSSTSSLSGKSEQQKLVVQIVKPIEAGQELLLWFSEDILAMLQVAFLTPANIQGQKKYTCTKCSSLYESPNPLKLHITLGCGKNSIVTLWERLATCLETNVKQSDTKETFSFRLTPEPHLVRAIDLTTNKSDPATTIDLLGDIYRPYSAFKPFRRTQSSPTGFHLLPLVQEVPVQLNREGLDDEAQIETLVSSLGKSKQGHICLYCGKCYSRKYGLKIHIRTHTGYKPLKCKYCLRPFGDPSNLNKHVRLHAEGDTPYRCELCGKVLVRRRDLERHLKSRHMSDLRPGTGLLDDSNESLNTSEEEENAVVLDN